MLSFYFQSPKQALIAAALLQYRPSLMDILPMYIVFMLLTPVARRIARSLGWETVLFVSLIVWAGAQLDFRAWVYNHTSFVGLHVPQTSTGAFDLYGWQLLWIIGLAFGSIHAESLSAAPSNAANSDGRIPGWLVKLSCIVAVAFLVLRYAPDNNWVNVEAYAWLIDKWHLGPARLIDFAAIALLLVRYGHHIAGLLLFRPLASLGQASIQVFSVHVLFCIAGQGLSNQADAELPWWEQGILLSVTISALFITAHLANKRSRKKGRASSVRPREKPENNPALLRAAGGPRVPASVLVKTATLSSADASLISTSIGKGHRQTAENKIRVKWSRACGCKPGKQIA